MEKVDGDYGNLVDVLMREQLVNSSSKRVTGLVEGETTQELGGIDRNGRSIPECTQRINFSKR
jgi:hypothetical protein